MILLGIRGALRFPGFLFLSAGVECHAPDLPATAEISDSIVVTHSVIRSETLGMHPVDSPDQLLLATSQLFATR